MGKKYLAISRSGISAVTDLPVSLSSNRQTFSVVTEDGHKAVTYYPDTIADHLDNLQLIDREDSPFDKTKDDDLSVVLTYKDQELIYLVKGTARKYFLSFIPINVKQNIIVSAQTKEIKDINKTTFYKILDAFSIAI